MTITAKPGAFYYEKDGLQLGEVTYFENQAENSLVLNHTFVDPSLRGQNIAHQLVDEVVKKARTEGKRVQPACRYAAVLFRRFRDEYQDVAATSQFNQK
ncbi:GNAT family N-acetyltransferase [Fructobacillus americanaquae]|uniref:N-acetyltransferase n=1 Tax=Fructobacillus americanaquae TaxID=2940302 RepID=A0ABY5C1H8_9LACO|nr:GNAT family N-acetyltransferase [Fructobacillus americanaquae]USS92632.1 N-acetyltransferase [Fructobacillus americanaquae]